MAPGAAPATLIKQPLPPPAEGQGTQAREAAGLSLSRRDIGRRCRAAARLVLPASSRCAWRSRSCPNVFAEPGVEDFIRGACMARLAGGGRVIDIHALECDDEVIAIFAGVADGHRFSMMFNTYTMSGNSRFSPGLILMRNIIDALCRARLSRARSRRSVRTNTSGCSARATSRSSTASSRSARAAGSRPRRCQASTAPSTW